MSSFQDLRTSSVLQPALLSILAFTLGYHLRPYLSAYPSSSSPTSAYSSSTVKSPSLTPAGAQKRSLSTSPPVPRATSGSDTELDPSSDEEDAALALSSNISAVRASLVEEVKLVLVVNDSLKMSKGKIAAQAGHATLACAMMMKEQNPKLFNRWRSQGQAKVALKCGSTAELDDLASQARSLSLCARTIQDAGRTQVAAGSKTILGIGPGPAKLINAVTGKLKLL